LIAADNAAMRHDVLIQFDAQRSVEIALAGGALPSPEAARAWLDAEFTRLQCEPLRPSGKLLTADRLLVIAQEAGPAGFDDPAWRQAYAAAACGVLGKAAVTVNLATMKVSAA
jgi:hypothetical protein